MPDNTLTPGAPGTSRLRTVKIAETSGVDHPAHKHPGWLLMKSLGSDKAESLIAAFGKERNMPEPKGTPVFTALFKSLEGCDYRGARDLILKADESVILKELTEADIVPARDAVAGAWKMLRDLADKGNPDTPSADGTAPAAPAAPDAASVLASADLQKAVGVEGVALLKAMHEEGERTRAKLEKAELDAFTKSFSDDFGTIIEKADIDPIAKALRSMDADAAALVRKALEKTKSLNASAEAIITKEIGGGLAAAVGGAEEQLNSIAKSYVEAGAEKSFPAAFAKACENNPALYERMSTERV